MDNENRKQIIQDFLHNPERTIFQQLDEFKTAIETLVNVFKDSKLSEVELMYGENGTDGKNAITPKRGVDYMTEDDIKALESFIMDKIPKEGVDYPTFAELKTFISEKVAEIPRIQGDKGESIQGEPGKDGSPDTGKQIIEKLRALDKNQSLQIKDIRGLDNKLKSVDDLFDELEKKIDEQRVVVSTGISEGGGGSYTLPTASTSVLGGVKVDGTSVTITNGVISAPTGGSGDMLKATYDPANGAKQVAFADQIPTATSDLTNDSGFLTAHQDISGKENTSNKVTSISAGSTDTQYPSAKLVYDQLAGKGVGDMVLASAQSNTGIKTFDKGTLKVKGTGAGSTDITTANTSATSYVATLPDKTGTIAMTSDITGTNSNTNTGDEVKATATENVAGTDDTKYLTALSNVGAYVNSLSRQAIINGNFDVWQRGTSFSANGALFYTADRWDTYNVITNQASTITRQTAGLDGSKYCLRYQRTAGQTGTIETWLAYCLESVDSVKFRSKKVTCSFWARAGANYSSTSGKLTVSILSQIGAETNIFGGAGATNEKYVVANLTTTWQKFTLTTTNALASNITQLSIAINTTPVGTAGANDYYEIAQVQLNEGSVALPFMPKSFAQELQDCQRYYCKTFDYATAPAQNAGASGSMSRIGLAVSNYERLTWQFPVRMRTSTPTVTTYNPLATNANWRNTNADSDQTVEIITVDRGGTCESHAAFGAENAASTINHNYIIHATADAEL